MPDHLTILLKKSASEHNHLCPRQVLGVRMALAGLSTLGLKAPAYNPHGIGVHRDRRMLCRWHPGGEWGDGWSPYAQGTGPGKNCRHLHQYKIRNEHKVSTQVGCEESCA